MIQPNTHLIESAGLAIGSATFLVAIIQYVKNKLESEIHLLKVLITQLDLIRSWIGGGSGYGEELTEKQKWDNANPFKRILEVDRSPTTVITAFEGIKDMPIGILGEIFQLNQDLIRINNVQEARDILLGSNIELSFEIKAELDDAQRKSQTFSAYIESMKAKKQKNSKLKYRMIQKYIYYGELIHCNFIGRPEWGGRQHYERIRRWVKNELKRMEKTDYLFSLPTITMTPILSIFLAYSVLGCLASLGIIRHSQNLPLVWVLLSAVIIGLTLWYLREARNRSLQSAYPMR